ncbi:MAG: hypothetical protein J3K34DRAFT_525910 [Monoraphidium minutum]|nr:MAG: hypothetical protein J3K34DRAFT_525910 [Monoraphidium minutum]
MSLQEAAACMARAQEAPAAGTELLAEAAVFGTPVQTQFFSAPGSAALLRQGRSRMGAAGVGGGGMADVWSISGRTSSGPVTWRSGCWCGQGVRDYAPVCDPATRVRYPSACAAGCQGVDETVPCGSLPPLVPAAAEPAAAAFGGAPQRLPVGGLEVAYTYDPAGSMNGTELMPGAEPSERLRLAVAAALRSAAAAAAAAAPAPGGAPARPPPRAGAVAAGGAQVAANVLRATAARAEAELPAGLVG